MWDWSLGQAGFGEQIQIYGETFWQQVGATVLWASLIILAMLGFMTLVMIISGRPDVSEKTGRPQSPAEAPPIAPLRPAGTERTSQAERRAA